MVEHAGHLDDAAQLDLSPAAPDLRSPQGPSHGKLTNGVITFVGNATKFFLKDEEVSEIFVRLQVLDHGMVFLVLAPIVVW